jgi:aminoglycoside phosphotransferase (APT) family kinase protein
VTGGPLKLGALVARGTRSTLHAYGPGAVVKVPTPATRDAWIVHEARHAEATRAAGAPVPELLGLVQVDGRTASVWERIPGESMWQHVVSEPARAAELGGVLAELQLRLFGLHASVVLPSQSARLAVKVRRAAAMIDPSFARALELLPPARGRLHLCHGDLHPSNVILAPHGPVLVDWFDASRGHPVSDVARTLLLLTAEDGVQPDHLPGADPVVVARLVAAYVERLREAGMGLEPERLAPWKAVNAVARISEGVAMEHLREVWSRYVSADGAFASVR